MSGIERCISDATEDTGAPLALVAIALSAGGLAPLRKLVRELPRDAPAAFVVAQHANRVTMLPEILAADTRLPVILASSGMPLGRGRIYVCPPARHLIVSPERLLIVSSKERVRYFRPSGDWLFESAAAAFAEHTFAVVLSGLQNDGARGAVAVRRAGGTVIVQAPSTCEYSEMPVAAISTGAVNYVLEPAEMPSFLHLRFLDLPVEGREAYWEEPFGHATRAARRRALSRPRPFSLLGGSDVGDDL